MKTTKERYEKILANGECTHFAFWKYDNFPYVLGSPVSRLKVAEDCKVTAFSSAYGGYITANHLSENLEESLDILVELEALRVEYTEAQAKLREEYTNKAKVIAPFLSKVIKDKS